MDQRRNSRQIQARTFGVAVTEYALLLAMIAVLAIGGVSMLGDASHDLFAQVGNEFYKLGFGTFTPLKGSMKALALQVGGLMNGAVGAPGSIASSKAYLKGGGYYNVVINPATGQPRLKLVNGTSGVNINVSSVEGSRFNTLGSVMLAAKLDTLAEQQTDPQLKDYYAKLARLSYYMGGAEGVMDNVGELAWGNVYPQTLDLATGNIQVYSLGDGLRDLNAYQDQFQALLSNPPANLNAQEFRQVIPYAADSSNIAQNYLNNYQQFLGPNGEVPKNFGDPNQCHLSGGCDLGTPGPGASLADVSNAVANPAGAHEMLGVSYDSLVPLDRMKTMASQFLANYQAQDTPVASTFEDAKTVDSHAP